MKKNLFDFKVREKGGGLLRVHSLLLISYLAGLLFLGAPVSGFAESPHERVRGVKTQGGSEAPAPPPQGILEKESREAPSPVRRRILARVPSLPFWEDRVYGVSVGYGNQVEISLPEEVKNIVPPDEQLVSADYVEKKAYLRGIVDAPGESTNLHINTVTGKTLHLKITLVEPGESDQALKFIPASQAVFTGSHVQKEIAEERKKLEEEMGKREANLEEVTEKLAEDRLKVKLLREEREARRQKRVKKNDLELATVQASRVGERAYVKFVIKNVSGRDFSISSILLARGLPDPKKPGKILGYETIEADPPTLDSEVILSGGEVKALVSFNQNQIKPGDKVTLKIVEAGGSGRVAEFKELELFSPR